MDFRAKSVTKEELADLYRFCTTLEVATMLGCSAEYVRKKMIEFGIPRRISGGVKSFIPDPKELEALYQKHSMKQVARLYGVGETVVWKRLKQYGIKLKDHEDGGHRKKRGRAFSLEHRQNLSKAHRGRWAGDKNPHWNGGIHGANIIARSSGAYKQWKNAALEVRGFACEECGAKHKSICECCGVMIRLHVHHKLSFAEHIDKRYDPENTEVLCPKCHNSRHGR